MKWVEEVVARSRAAIEVEGRTGRLIAIMITLTMCFVIVSKAT